jgi:hypothetical protein
MDRTEKVSYNNHLQMVGVESHGQDRKGVLNNHLQMVGVGSHGHDREGVLQ